MGAQSESEVFHSRNRYRGVRFTYLRVEDPVKLITKDQWLVIVVHGFTSNSKADWAHDLKDKALDNVSMNEQREMTSISRNF